MINFTLHIPHSTLHIPHRTKGAYITYEILEVTYG